MRNQLSTRVVTREWLQGVDAMDAGAALGGLMASTMIPGMVVRDAATQGQKIWKLIVSLGSAIGAGFIFRNISPTAGKMAVAGGLAGSISQVLAMFTNIKIGGPGRRIGETNLVSPSPSRSDETVNVIIP